MNGNWERERESERERGASVVQWQRTGLLVNRSSGRSCSRGMIHNKIHLISPGCPRPNTALQSRIVALNSIHFIHIISLLHTQDAEMFCYLMANDSVQDMQMYQCGYYTQMSWKNKLVALSGHYLADCVHNDLVQCPVVWCVQHGEQRVHNVLVQHECRVSDRPGGQLTSEQHTDLLKVTVSTGQVAQHLGRRNNRFFIVLWQDCLLTEYVSSWGKKFIIIVMRKRGKNVLLVICRRERKYTRCCLGC